MKKCKLFLFTLFFITQQTWGQGYSINPKYTFVTNNKYTVGEYYINFSYEIQSINLAVGLDFGYVNMFYDDHDWQSVIGHESKGVIGVGVSYFPFNKINNIIKPYLGIKTLFISDKHFSLGSGGGMYFTEGFYFPNSKNDRAYSASIGSLLILESLNFIFEVGYEYRKFTFTYDEYTYVEYIHHSEKKTFNSIIYTLGIQIEL